MTNQIDGFHFRVCSSCTSTELGDKHTKYKEENKAEIRNKKRCKI